MVTPPQKVIETHRDHMWSSPHATQVSLIPSRAHPRHHWVISSARLWSILGPLGHYDL